MSNSKFQVRHTLFKQILLIVGSVLAFELLLLSTLAWLTIQAEDATRRAEQSRNIVIGGTSALNLINECLSSLVAYEMIKTPATEKRYSESFSGAAAQIAALQNSMTSDAVDARELKEISQTATEILDTLQEAKEAIEKKKVGSCVWLNGVMVGELDPTSHKLIETINSLVNRHRKKQLAAEAAQSTKTYIKYLVIAGLLLNIVISLVIVALFSKGLVRRISLILENMNRFERFQPLLPSIGGNDEVSIVDARLRELVEALNKAIHNQRSIFENTPIAIVALGHDHLIQSINPQGEHMLSFSSAEVIGKPLSLLVPDLDIQALHATTSDLKSTKPYEVLCRQNDGTIFPAELFASSFAATDGDGIITSFVDLTERKEIERLKRELLAIVSHDIKTPLASIQGTLETLESGRLGNLPESMHNMIGLSRQETKRLIALASDLLDIAKMESGKFVLDKHEVQLATLTQQAVLAVTTLADQKLIIIHDMIDPCDIHIDGDRIIQVLVNFLTNAVKYSPPETKITLRNEITNDNVTVFIQDEGRGIPQDKLNSVFNRFEQIASTDHKIGTGLGLSICKFIVESHGGEVGVSSEEGVGSCFWFTLPHASIPDPG